MTRSDDFPSFLPLRFVLSCLSLSLLYISMSRIQSEYTLPRTSNPTVGFHRILSEKLSDPIRVRWKLSESLGSDSDRKWLDVGNCQNGPVSCRNLEISAFSEIRQFPVGIRYQGFRQFPTNSYRIRWAEIDLARDVNYGDNKQHCRERW